MCGFVLIVGRNGYVPSPQIVERMTSSIEHRGPDDCGYWSAGNVAMGFRRLAIIDTTPAGHQPMVSADGQHVLVFNGEIFNYVELRRELRALGHRFRSSGDTEVLLAAWRQWGERATDHLIGMFAFAVWDRQQNALFGARDHFGIKPLFLYEGKKATIIASEIKAIHASGLGGYTENWSAVASYLVDGQLDEPSATCFTEISHIAAGHLFRVDADGRVRQRRYHQWSTEVLESADDAPSIIADLLEESVHLRTRADVPVGVCLSGGLDSTAIACSIARRRQTLNDSAPLLAFNFKAPEYDESPYIAETLRQTGATLVPLHMDVRSAWGSLSRVLHFQDEPMHSMNALVGYELMRLARRHGTLVVLNGQGADETLAGYSSYHEAHWLTSILNGRPDRALSDIREHAKAFGANPYYHVRDVVRRLAFSVAARIPGYGFFAQFARASWNENNPWYTSDLTNRVPPRTTHPQSRLEAQQRDAVTDSPLPLYLRIEDRNSMAHGVEVRVPFLDPRLTQYALSLPIASRMRGPLNKFALREGLRGRIPELVRSRVDKMGFPVPADRWLANELYEPLRALLDSSVSRSRGLFRTDALIAQLDASRGDRLVPHAPFFRAANVEAWLAMLADRRVGTTPVSSPIIVRDSSGPQYHRPSDTGPVGRNSGKMRKVRRLDAGEPTA